MSPNLKILFRPKGLSLCSHILGKNLKYCGLGFKVKNQMLKKLCYIPLKWPVVTTYLRERSLSNILKNHKQSTLNLCHDVLNFLTSPLFIFCFLKVIRVTRYRSTQQKYKSQLTIRITRTILSAKIYSAYSGPRHCLSVLNILHHSILTTILWDYPLHLQMSIQK